MKIIVLGATGRTGECVVDQALEAGHSVTAVVRTPSKITKKHANLRVVKGSVFSEEELTEAFRGHDAVISALGFSRTLGFSFRQHGYSDSMKSVISAMAAGGVKRLVVMTAFYTDVISGRGIIYNWFVIPMIKEVLKDMKAMEDWLMAEVADIEWTVVRPGMLTNSRRVDQIPLEEEGGQFVADNRAAVMIPRANVAAYMLSQIPESNYTRKVVAIAMH